MDKQNIRGKCVDNPSPWGAGQGPANVREAVSACMICPVDHEQCLSTYAARVRPEHSAGMVVAGLSDKALRVAIRQFRKKNPTI